MLGRIVFFFHFFSKYVSVRFARDSIFQSQSQSARGKAAEKNEGEDREDRSIECYGESRKRQCYNQDILTNILIGYADYSTRSYSDNETDYHKQDNIGPNHVYNFGQCSYLDNKGNPARINKSEMNAVLCDGAEQIF